MTGLAPRLTRFEPLPETILLSELLPVAESPVGAAGAMALSLVSARGFTVFGILTPPAGFVRIAGSAELAGLSRLVPLALLPQRGTVVGGLAAMFFVKTLLFAPPLVILGIATALRAAWATGTAGT
jgi:hypothetical protein